jgi:hypothetical protein
VVSQGAKSALRDDWEFGCLMRNTPGMLATALQAFGLPGIAGLQQLAEPI